MSKKQPSVDDILCRAHELHESKKRKGVVQQWEEANPEKAKIFYEAIDRARAAGDDLAPVIETCKEMLGGPPGKNTTVREAIHARDERLRT